MVLKISKCYFYKSQSKSFFKFALNPPKWSSEKYVGDFLYFDVSIFYDFFDNLKFTIIAYEKKKTEKSQLSGNQ